MSVGQGVKVILIMVKQKKKGVLLLRERARL
ncbi:MAG: hypothetical protein RL491_537, partial [Bacteroidota bacterium]